MAETAVSVAIETLETLLRDKISFLKGVNDQVQNLQSELETMKCFLKDADRKQDEDESIRNWVSQVREVSIDAEDAIELFIAKMESIKRKPSLIRFAYIPIGIYYHNKVGKQIESIQSRIRAIEANRQKYDIQKLGEGSHDRAQELRLIRTTVPNTQDKNIVGTDRIVASLVSQILEIKNRRCVFSITGMGGIGKTTLARQIYNHNDVQNQFSCRAWICVSERYNFKEMAKKIIKRVDPGTNDSFDGFDDADLKQKLHECLKGKRYLVVVDDIWQKQGWDVLDEAFPDGGEGGRVLLTSRDNSVAEHASSFIKPYKLPTLGDEDSWELFTKQAFVDGQCPPVLEDVGRQIVRGCGGLPLAIATIARLLQQKKTLKHEWDSVLHDINGHLSRGGNEVSAAILELSYCDLSWELKFCFKYLGLFPEDYELSVKKLARLWVAEGIAGKSEGSKCLEELETNYMEQLINRNLVQVARLTLDDRVKKIRLHDLLRDLAIRKGKDENFLHIIASDHLEASGKSTHLAAHVCPFSNYLNPRLRTFLFVSKELLWGMRDNFNFKGVKMLRVLDLDGVIISNLPKEIGEMSLLRYLSLRGASITKLPHSFGRLRHLQYLDVRNSVTVEFPRVVLKLESLLYIDSTRMIFAGGGLLKLDRLKRIRRLSCIEHAQLMNSNIQTLTSLQQLGIWIPTPVKMDKLFILLSQLENLSSLKLHSNGLFRDDSSLDGIFKLHRLSELKIAFLKMPTLPPLPPNLSRLSLAYTCLQVDPTPMLATMKCLSFLKLDSLAYQGKTMTIPQNGFRQLNFLELTFLEELEEIYVEKDALLELRCLRIKDCKQLKILPSMTSLQKLELIDMPTEFIQRIPDSYKVSHVATLNIYRTR